MPAMDLSVNQELMRMQKRYETEYGNHVFKLLEPFRETDLTGNNNFLNPLKTETASDHAHDTATLFQVNCKKETESFLSYSSLKKAMDLRIHNRTVDGGKRTIFEDAEYFSRNCCYKLLPITFEQVDETIIHTEHNYSLLSLSSDLEEAEENCSRIMDYSQIRERNYKRRRSKYREGSDQEDVDVDGSVREETAVEGENWQGGAEQESLVTGQPLDLSVGPVVQEEKTEALGREELTSIGSEGRQADSDKENESGEVGEVREEVSEVVGGIKVTITRPDERENYQPCDLFLNDIARLVPWLIDKDCLEVDILDRTCDRQEELRKHRLYYVIAESTWRSFQSTNERVILTSDHSLGQPLRKAERDERPSYLVFDQFSLAKCLAEYCQEIGGCFEYTCVEEGMEEIGKCLEKEEEEKKERENVLDEGEEKEENEKPLVKEEEENEEKKKRDLVEGSVGGEEVEGEESEKESGNEVGEREGVEGEGGEGAEGVLKVNVGEGRGGELSKEDEVDKSEALERSESDEKGGERAEEDLSFGFGRSGEGEGEGEGEKGGSRVVEGSGKREEVPAKGKTVKKAKKSEKTEGKKSKRVRKPMQQTKSRNCRMSTRSKSTSELSTSQMSDKQVSTKEKRKRRDITPPKEETLSKRRRTAKESETSRCRRSTTLATKVKVEGSRKRAEKKESGTGKKAGERERRKQRLGDEGNGSVLATGRSLRSRGVAGQGKEGKERKETRRRSRRR